MSLMPDESGLVTDEDYEPWKGPIVPVHIESSSAGREVQVAAEFAGLQTYTVPDAEAGGQPIQVALRAYRRDELRLWIPQFNTGTGLSTEPSVTSGVVTDPSAGEVIAAAPSTNNLTIYLCEWMVGLNGTVTTADGNNMNLNTLNFTVPTAVYPGAIGSYRQDPLRFQAAFGSVEVTAIAAASGADAIYSAQIALTPLTVVGTIAGVLLATDPGPLMNYALNGGSIPNNCLDIPAANIPFGGSGGLTYRSQKPLYALAIGGTAELCVMDLTYAQVRRGLKK